MQELIKKVRSKYTLYFLCFMALNLIEFLRSTQRGNVWSAAANCTGLVMMVIVFSQLPVREFFRPLNYVYTFVCLAAIGIIYWHWTHHIGEYYFGQIATAVMNIWWLGLVVPYLFRKVIEEKKIPLRIGALGWTWIAFTVWTVISVAGRWWPIWFLLMFGSFYLIRFSEEDKEALIKAMIDGTIASFFVIQSYAYLFRPYDMLRYRGAFSNSNMMSLYYLIVYGMILLKLHLLHVQNAKKGWKLFYFIGAGGLLGFMFLTISRTSWGVSVVITIVYGITVLRKAWGDSFSKLIVRGSALVLCMVLTFPVVFCTVRWIPTIHPHPIWYEGEYIDKPVRSWDPADSEKYIDMDEFLEHVFKMFGGILSKLDARNPFVLHARAESGFEIIPEPESWEGSLLGVRKAIFQTYLKYSTWIGNDKQKGLFIFEESRFRVWHGQNLWIQIIYYFGYPAGFLLALLTVLTLFKTARGAGNILSNAYAAVPLMICLIYFLFGITEVVWNPGQLILTYVFIVMHPQWVNGKEGNKQDGKICQIRE